ncbi:MAG: glycosyltransferase family 2 protein [Planctomycetaceae bacterium]
MSADIEVSVLVTVYNRERYLAECLDSILCSTFQRFEVVVVDDGSRDASREIAADYAARDRRIRVFHNETNLGDYPNRNRAAGLARGRWLKYVDSDDRIEPHGLETMLQAVAAFPDAALALSYPRPEGRQRPFCLPPAEAYYEHFVNHQGFFCSGPLLALIRADAFRQVGGFRPQARNMGDAILWLELCRRWPVVITEPNLTFWRQHDGQEYQLMRDGGWDNVVTHCLQTQVLLRDFLATGCPLTGRQLRRVRGQLQFNNWRRLAWHFKHGRLRQMGYEAAWAVRSLLGMHSSRISASAPTES